MKRIIILLLLLTTLPMLLNAWADWQSVANQHFRIYFKGEYSAQAEQALLTLEYYRPKLEQITGNAKGRIPITIEDIGNIANGYTDPVGTRIALFAYPPTSDELAVGEDWWQLVACHEYTHELQMTRASGVPEILRLLLGNYFYPHLWQPAWMTEGITVYSESQLSKYAGRLNGGTYPSIIRVLAKQGKLPSPTKASYSSFDTPQASYYTFGGVFYDYLTRTYGAGKLAELFSFTSSNTWSYANVLLPNLALDKAYLATFGKDTATLWADWQASEQAKSYRQPTHNITDSGWDKSDLKQGDGYLYYISSASVKTGPTSAFHTYKLNRINLSSTAAKTPQIETLVTQETEFPAGYAVRNGNLYYSRSEWDGGFANSEMDGIGSVTQIWMKNLQTGSRSKLYEGPVRAFWPMQNGSLVISEDNATHSGSILSRLNPGPGQTLSKMYQTEGLIYAIYEYGNNLVLGYKPPWHNNGIYLFEPAGQKLTPLISTAFYAAPVSVEGNELVFNAVFDNEMKGYVMNLQTKAVSRLTDYSDVRSPVLGKDGSAYFISLNAKGYDLYKDSANRSNFSLPAAQTASARPNLNSGAKSSTLIHEGSATSYMSNLGHLLVPRVLHVPIITADTLNVNNLQQPTYHLGLLLYGNDALGDFPAWQAQVIYNTDSTLAFPNNISYKLSLVDSYFHPIKHVLTYEYEYKVSHALSSQQYYTFYQSRNYGLDNVTAGFTYTYDQFKGRKIWDPFVLLNVSWASGNLLSQHMLPYETKDWLPSDRNRKGWQSITRLHQQLPLAAEFKGQALIARDPDANVDEVFGPIRGYNKNYSTNSGAQFQASIYKPVLKIREGLWSPQIYIEDIDLGVFYDYGRPWDLQQISIQSAYGAELLAELGIAYNYRLNAGVRYSQNRDKNNKFEIILGALF